MPQGGDETLALWRESGEWWASEQPTEIRRYLDEKGIRREVCRPLGPSDANPEPATRIPKVRDDTVTRALGYEDPIPARTTKARAGYALLHALSGYSFGRGSMLAVEIATYPEAQRYQAVLLADHFSLMGVREFDTYARMVDTKPILGATIEMDEGGELVLVAKTGKGYRNLSRLLSECHLGEPRLYPLCTWPRLEKHTEDLLCLTGGDGSMLNRQLLRGQYEEARQLLVRLTSLYGKDDVFIQIERSYRPWEIAVNHRLLQLADDCGLTPVAGGPITHRRPEHFPAQDILVCVETLCAVDEVVGRKPLRAPEQPQVTHPPRRGLNAERYLHTPEEMDALFCDRRDLLENTLKLADRCEDKILPGRVSLPKFCNDEPTFLRQTVYAGAMRHYGRISHRQRNRLELEMERIVRNNFVGHFLVAWDMCKWAKEQGILHSGRGSVVDSAVAYCLGLSRIDAIEHNLHFDRFLPDGAGKRPDIDIDFEARRREDVRQYLVHKYGEEHVATVAAIGSYRTRGIVREVGKAMGIPEDSLDYLAKRLHGSVTPDRLETEIDKRPELRDSNIPRERFHWVFQLARDLMDQPRNARSHSSGVVVSATPIADIVPVMQSAMDGVRIIQWDKRSAKHCFDKFDILCLRGNDVLSNTQEQIRRVNLDFDVEKSISLDDPEPYRVMRSGQLIGVPQSASPAMRQAHIRIQTKDLKDASIVQAAIRPGVGGAVKVNEFIARRKGKPFKWVHDDFREILESTHGIIVFQEQVDLLLQKFGGYSSDEAEEVREGLYKRRREEYARRIKEEVLERVRSNGYSEEVAQELYQYVEQFKGYGFAQGHALAFADISIRSVWCQQNYPSEYFAALLNAQPAGYYGPCTLANEARARGVRPLPPDINRSSLTFMPEDVMSEEDPKLIMPNGGIRTAFNQIGGLQRDTRERMVASRIDGPFRSYFDFVARVRPDRDELERLILCGAFDTLTANRRALLWAIPSALEHSALVASMQDALPLELQEPPIPADVPDFTDAERAIHEREVLGMDVKHHLMAFERKHVTSKGGITADQAGRLPNGTKAFVVGNPIRLRFPPTASGKRVMFFDLEDESGLLNVTCFDDVYQRYGGVVICSPYITLRGVAQVRDGHNAFLAQQAFSYKPQLRGAERASEPLPVVVGDYLHG